MEDYNLTNNSIPQELIYTYDIDRAIGSGGGGVVYLATHKRLQKKVVLKKIRTEVQNFVDCRREVDILKNLRHSYLPQVIDFIECSDGSIFTVMDYINGRSLQDMLDSGYKFSENEVTKYCSQLTEAVSYLHKQTPPIIHGDIKPDNIMVTPEGNICLIDFNISGMLEGNGLKSSGYTPGYASPEQIYAFEHAEELEPAAPAIMSPNVMTGPATVMNPNSMPGDATVMGPSGMPGNATVMLTPEAQAQNAEAQLHKYDNFLQSQSAPVSAPTPVSMPSKNNSELGHVDERTDIYSIGATIYVLLGGKVSELINHKIKFSGNLSNGYRVIISKALEEKAKKRYAGADDLLYAFSHVQEMDKSYRALLRKQHLKQLLYVVLIAVAVIMINYGSQKMSDEREERYASYIETLKSASENEVHSGESDKAVDDAFDKAVEIHADSLEAYYYKALYIYSVGDTKKTEGFIEYSMDKKPIGTDEMAGNMYYMLADCYFTDENYGEAAEWYEKSVDEYSQNSAVYRDYAISLINSDELDQARKVINQASELGVSAADLSLVKGELARIEGKNSEAVEYYKQSIAESNDEQVKVRAYIAASKAYMEIGNKAALKDGITLLNTATEELSMSKRLLVYEQLGAMYVKLGELTDNKNNYKKAAETYETIVEMGWANNVTYSNLIVLYQRMGDIDSAVKWSDRMCDVYSDSYVSFMRRALVEIEYQKTLKEKKRDYSSFKKAYTKAKSLYAESGNGDDMEMLLLDNAYDQLVAGRWIIE